MVNQNCIYCFTCFKLIILFFFCLSSASVKAIDEPFHQSTSNRECSISEVISQSGVNKSGHSILSQSQAEITGEVRLLAIMVRFVSSLPADQVSYRPVNDLSIDPDPVTPEKLASILFDNRYPAPPNTFTRTVFPPGSLENFQNITINDFFREVSYDKMRLTGIVVGPYIIDDALIALGSGAVIDAAVDSAISDGHNISWDGTFVTGGEYDRVLVTQPRIPDMVGSVAVAHGDATWYNGILRYYSLLIHEIAHTFGAGHASAWYCTSMNWPQLSDVTCGPILGYGDIFDPMGSGTGHFNPWLKYKLGWIDESQIQDLREEGYYQITPIETPVGVKALRIQRDSSYYYFHFRRHIGFDDFWPDTLINHDGLYAHRVDPFDTQRDGFMLDMPPMTGFPNTIVTPRDTKIQMNEFYSDPFSGFKIIPDSITGTGENTILHITFSILPFGDIDSDGILNVNDNCPFDSNTLQIDIDGDLVGFPCDNCSFVPNPDQADSDNNGIGDACDNLCCMGNVGDANLSRETIGEVTVGDITVIIDHLFGSGAALPCVQEADANRSGGVLPTVEDITVGDISDIVNYLFGSGLSLGNCL